MAPLPLSFVHTEGDRLVDEHGRTVVLRGINISGGPREATPEILDAFEYFGFNAIRVVLSWGEIEPSPDVIDPAYLERVDQVLADAEARGLYLVLDMHQGFWSAYAFPEWTCDTPPDGMDIPATMACAAAFFASDELVGHFHEVWRLLAARYADREVVLGYDLFNEPPPGDMGSGMSGTFDEEVLYPFYDALIDTIREEDPRHVVMVEPNFFHTPGATAGFPAPFTDDDVVYAAHIYPLHEYRSGEGWVYMFEPTADRLDDIFDDVRHTAEVIEAPLFIGEWGVIGDDPASVAWLSAAVARFEELQMSWAIWTRGGSGGAFALYDNETVPIFPFRELLLRPFVHAAAARDHTFRSYPWSGGFDLALEVGADQACVPTELVVPIQAGGVRMDYQVVEGAALLAYDRDTQKLTVLPRCGGCTVRVEARLR